VNRVGGRGKNPLGQPGWGPGEKGTRVENLGSQGNKIADGETEKLFVRSDAGGSKGKVCEKTETEIRRKKDIAGCEGWRSNIEKKFGKKQLGMEAFSRVPRD